MNRSTSSIGTGALLAMVVLACIVDAQADNAPRELNRIRAQYLALRGDPGQLVRLDGELRRLLPRYAWQGSPVENRGFGFAWEEIGVRPLPFEGELLGYSGKLLWEAHQLDRSAHRSNTLFATVFGPDGEDVGTLPSREAAEAYLKEFSTGPFAMEAHLALGGFYEDLYKVIQSEEKHEARNYKFACYQQFIDSTPLVAQRRRAQEQAVHHYDALARLLPHVANFAEEGAAARKGQSDHWHFCTD